MSQNFGFLEAFDASLCAEAVQAERCFAELEAYDLAVAGFRRFVERMTELTLKQLDQPGRLARERLRSQLDRLRATGIANELIMGMLHEARRLGNKGSHVGPRCCSAWDAVQIMRLARKLAVWWVGMVHSAADDLKVPGFKVPQTGQRALDSATAQRVAAEDRREASLTEAEKIEEARAAARARLVVHSALSTAYQSLSPSAQKRLGGCVEQLREDPLNERWVYRPIDGAADDKLRSLEVGAGLHLITAVPPEDDVVFALWACSAEEMRAWARAKRVEVHPALGTVQLYDVEDVTTAAAAGQGEEPLFAPFSDEQLVGLGVPSPLLAAVRAIASEEALHRLAPLLPGEAGDALVLLKVAGSVDEVRRELELEQKAETVDVEDFGRAAQHPSTKRTFRMLEQDDDLEAALGGTLEAWRLFLHPDQRALVQMQAKGPVRVLGGAGTGKTVALLHRAAWLLQEGLVQGRLLVTTYTRNLALDLEHQLGRMVDGLAARGDVWNLHRLARRVANEGPYRDFEILQPSGAERLWDAALVHEELGLPRAFYESEWRDVVQAHGITEERPYLLVSRRGRGTALGRRQRRSVWKVFAAFARYKEERRLAEWADLVRSARELVESGQVDPGYGAVLADEVQDFTPQELRLLRAVAPAGQNDLFLVGDAHQRIYGTRTTMSDCGIEIRGRSRRLKVNYRTTEEIRSFGVRVLEGLRFDDLDGGVDTLSGYRSLRSGLTPEIRFADDETVEVEQIAELLGRWRERYPADDICVAARTRQQVRRYRDALTARGFDMVPIRQEAPAEPGLRIATMHRLKGLEFSCVLLAGVRDGLVPLAPAASLADDPEALSAHELGERALLYVAATRARDELALTTGGPPSPWLSPP